MNKRKILPIIIYVAVLILAFSWIMGMFDSGEKLTYSQMVTLLENEQVSSFVVEDNTIHMELNAPYNGKTSVHAPLADPDGFRVEMRELLQKQTQSGVLKKYDFHPTPKISPFSYVIPIILAGAALIR